MANVVQPSPDSRLSYSHDNSSLTFQNCSAETVRNFLSNSPEVTALTLQGNWSDSDFLSFIPLMANVKTLILKDITISDNTLSEALLNIAQNNPFQGLYEEEKAEGPSEWSTDPVDSLSLNDVANEGFFSHLPSQHPLAPPVNTLRVPKLQHLTIESPVNLTANPLKLIATQLISLTLKNWPQSSLSEEDRNLFQ